MNETEIVADAIYLALGADGGGYVGVSPLERTRLDGKYDLRAIAKAAIAALDKPRAEKATDA